jgi:hypothetical protein
MALRNIILYNFRWKITALLLATLFWMVIKFTIASGRNQRLPHLPVMALKAADDPRVFRIHPPQVDVVVQSVREMRTQDLLVFVDLTTMPDVSATFKEVLVRAPEGTRLIRVEPSILVSVERIVPEASALTNSLYNP